MRRQRNWLGCKKELTGKYYLIVGVPVKGYAASRANYCFSCCNKWKEKFLIKKSIERGEAKIVEKETGNQIDDEISEFEDKWEKYSELDIQKRDLPNNETLLNLIQKARQELEPYLAKPEIVEKAWEKEYNTDIDMSFLYLFAESAREAKYKQAVVQPTIELILGRELNEEINTTTTGNCPGVPGRADENLKLVINL